MSNITDFVVIIYIMHLKVVKKSHGSENTQILYINLSFLREKI